MTPLTKPVRRLTRGALPGRRLVAELAEGDLLILRPHGTRRPETISLFDCYDYALRCRVNLARLEKAREVKARKQEARARRQRRRSLSP